MKMPKNWNKLTLNEQESWLVKKYQEMLSEVDSVTKMLAKIRGGQRIKVAEVDRPDEAILKALELKLYTRNSEGNKHTALLKVMATYT